MLQPKKSNPNQKTKRLIPKSKVLTSYDVDWNAVRSANDNVAVQAAKFFDPTGLSSWPDVGYAIDDYKKGKGSGLNVALNVLGALPVLGKLGKAAGTLSKSQKLAKATEKIVKVNKVLDKVEKVVPNVAKAIGKTSDIIAKGSRAGKANPVAITAKVVGKVAKGVDKVDTATRKFTGKVLEKIPGTKGDVGNIVNSATSLLNIGNIASDTKSVIDASNKEPKSNSVIDKTKTIRYYNTDPKKGEVEKPGQLANVQYVPVSNSAELKKWKEQKLAFGTNSQGIMKSKMNPRKKYGNGTSNIGANYIKSPAEALNDYNIQMAKVEAKAMSNPWIPIVAAVGGAAQSFVSKGINANVLKPGESADNGDTPEPAANGNNNVQADVEVEGGELYETPQGQVGEFEGPAHEQGGIPLEVGEDVQEGTKVYSDRLKVGNKTLAERKATRERQTANLEKIASQALVDQAVKNAAKRKMMAIEKEEMADLDFQEKVNNMQAMADTMVAAFGTGMAGLQDNPIGDSMEYGYGTGSKGVMKYYLGTDEDGIDPITGIKLPKAPTADMEANVIKNFQDDLGMDPNTPGYGKIWGPKSKALYKKQLGDVNVPTQEELLKDPWGWMTNTMSPKKGFTREGYKYLDPETPDLTGLTTNNKVWDKSAFANASTEPNPLFAITEAQPEEVSNLDLSKVSTETPTEKKQSKAGKFMGSIPGVGDLTKMFGNYLGMTAGMDTAAEQRASDITHTNVYKNAGQESQKMLDNAKQGIETSKAQAIVKASDVNRGGKRGGRNSARGVNQVRAMDWLYDTALQSEIANISAKAAEQMTGIDVQKSGVAMNADQLKGQGEYQAAMANEAAKDAYYTALGQGRKDFATGLQQTGKDLNDMKENKIISNLMKQYGKWVGASNTGELMNKAGITQDTKTKQYKDASGKILTEEEVQAAILKVKK